MSMRYQAGIVLPGYNALKVADAPTIGTATAGISGCASVTFTAPACVGGGAISSYRAVSSPGCFTASNASSPVVVSGLTNGSAYTFKVTAINAYGPSSPSAASNSITASVITCATYSTAGTFTWVAPTGVTSVSVLTVGAGGNGAAGCNCACYPTGCFSGAGGGGGGLAYRNNYAVTPGSSYTVFVGTGGGTSTSTGRSYFNSTAVLGANGGVSAVKFTGGSGGATLGVAGTTGYSGGTGGTGGTGGNNPGAGGGGSAGYSGNGGNGGAPRGSGSAGTTDASGGGGGGNGCGGGCSGTMKGGGGGGGIGIFGSGSVGAGGTSPNGGGGGSSGSTGCTGITTKGGNGGNYGGGGGGGRGLNKRPGGTGAGGVVRILYGGATRSFPSTNVGP